MMYGHIFVITLAFLTTLVACGNKKESSTGHTKAPIHQTQKGPKKLVERHTVTARLTSYDPQYPWSETSSAGHDDGESPLAGFIITSPGKYHNRRFAILFRHGGTHSAKGLKNVTGATFIVELPTRFLDSSAKSLDNSLVSRFTMIKKASSKAPVAKATIPGVTTGPPLITDADLTCTKASDCVRASIWKKVRGGWCPFCEDRAVTRATSEKLRAWYLAHQAPRCPRHDCLMLPSKVVCAKGLCAIISEKP